MLVWNGVCRDDVCVVGGAGDLVPLCIVRDVERSLPAEPLMPMLLRLWGSVRILEAVVAGHTLGNPIDRSHFTSPFGLAMPD